MKIKNILFYSVISLFLQASSKVEIDPEATEKIKVCRADFMHALEYDIKPVSQTLIPLIKYLYILAKDLHLGQCFLNSYILWIIFHISSTFTNL